MRLTRARHPRQRHEAADDQGQRHNYGLRQHLQVQNAWRACMKEPCT